MSIPSLVIETTPARAERGETLIGLGRAGLTARLGELGVPERQTRMRVGQLWNWLYVHGATDFARMTNIAKELRAELEANFTLARPEIVTEQVSSDGTRKWLLRLDRPRVEEVETVYIPEEDRGTLCISSQVGCTLDLQLLPHRHAEAGAQPDRRRDRRPDHGGARPPRRMAASIAGKRGAADAGARSPMSCSWAWASRSTISTMSPTPWTSPPTARAFRCRKRRITVSTSGVVPEISALGERDRHHAGDLAACAPRDELRDQLVPLNKKYPIAELLDGLPRLSRPVQRPAHHLRIRDAEGRQRHDRRRQGAGASCSQAFRPRSI